MAFTAQEAMPERGEMTIRTNIVGDKRDIEAILKAARATGDDGEITPELAERLAAGLRVVLKLADDEHLVHLSGVQRPKKRASRANHHSHNAG
jgi:hypothetical protein